MAYRTDTVRRRWFKDKAPRQPMEGAKGLRKCPHCGQANGWLQRDLDDRCAAGVGCRRNRFERGMRGV